ncbi:MAG: EcsC family protein [Acutalibacteraceae bacterium]
MRDPARGVVRTAAAAAAVRSAGLGLLGIGLPDIPVFTALLLRNMGQIAHGYGCGTGTRRDRLLWLRILDAALTDGPDYPRRARGAARPWAGKHDPAHCLPELTGRVAEGLSTRLLAAKFLQGDSPGRRRRQPGGQPSHRLAARLHLPLLQSAISP